MNTLYHSVPLIAALHLKGIESMMEQRQEQKYECERAVYNYNGAPNVGNRRKFDLWMGKKSKTSEM